jgi:hypothetical protein
VKTAALDLVIPDFLPLLKAGPGKSPEHGGCLMQFVSYLWRGEWTDRPECTNYYLGGQAIFVNDSISHRARPALAKFAPDLIGTSYSSISLNKKLHDYIARQRDMLYWCCDDALKANVGCVFWDQALTKYLADCIAFYRQLRQVEKRRAPRIVIEPDTWVGAVSLVGAAA